jgi:2-oxo-4-hydroxy-4-carboxy-5-ureidoimidazoline decarboxylase
VDAALAHHPRIGERIEASGVEAGFSRREQAGAGSDAASAAAWVAANREYEDRFDRIFLIRAAGRTRQEMLAHLRDRLGNDPATEARVRAGQLAEIALLRLQAQVVPTRSPRARSKIETPKKQSFQ